MACFSPCLQTSVAANNEILNQVERTELVVLEAGPKKYYLLMTSAVPWFSVLIFVASVAVTVFQFADGGERGRRLRIHPKLIFGRRESQG
jgi:hypothetical protein